MSAFASRIPLARHAVTGSVLLAGSMAAAVVAGAPAHAVDSEWSNPTAVNGVDDADAFRSINVAGVQGVVTDVEVTLVGVTHQFPDDLDVMLVGAGGQRVVLISDACGSSDVVAQDLRFDDEAAVGLADEAACSGGTFRPSNRGGAIDEWFFGAPTGTTLAAFDGFDPNGTWTLEVGDDSFGDAAKLAGGWRLHLGTATPLTCDGKVVTVELAKGEKPTAGSDVIRGTGGNDVINGLGGDDTICSLDGDDLVQGGAGDDLILGGAGSDTASYAGAPTSVTVTLAHGLPQHTGATTGTDTLKQLENLRGSAGSDVLTGNALDNELLGLAGLDDLRGAAGADKLVGGPDTDSCNGGTEHDTAASCETTVNVP